MYGNTRFFDLLLLVRPNLLSLGFCLANCVMQTLSLAWLTGCTNDGALLSVFKVVHLVLFLFFCPIKCPDYVVLALTTNLQRAFFRRISSWKYFLLQSIGCTIVESIRGRSAHLRKGSLFCFPTGVSRHDGASPGIVSSQG